MSQPIWKRLWSTDYSQVFEDETGAYEPEMEIAQEYETPKGRTKFMVYRFSLDKLKLVPEGNKAYLVPGRYDESWPHPLKSYEEWFAKDLKSVARSIGGDEMDLAKAFTSDDVQDRASAYEPVGGYHGFDNLDSDPRDLTEKELNKRWG
jgi:hypothetical protein